MNAPVVFLPANHDRSKYLGGSDIAALLGLSKWRTPLELFYDKTRPGWNGRPEDDAQRAKIFKRGKRLEPVVIEMMQDEFDIKITKTSPDNNPNRYVDKEFGFMAAEVDFEFEVTPSLLAHLPPGFISESLIGTIQNGEIKTVYPLAAHLWGEEFTEDVPIDYSAQSMHGLGVTGRDLCLYGVLFGADNLTLYIVNRDHETIAGIRAKAVEFWERHVIGGVEPDPITMADMKYLLAKVNGRPAEVDESIAEALQSLQTIRANVKALESDKERLEFQIADAIRKCWKADPTQELTDNAEIICNGIVIGSWKKQRGSYLDQKALKRDYPDIAQKLYVEHWFRVFRNKSSK